MRLVFVGPTLYGANLPSDDNYLIRPPARQGDIYQAVEEGANVLGLIDGVYEQVPAIWHKEILYGLSKGVHVLGAASMGALRAAECRSFGMIGIGDVYEGFASGRLVDDSDVAQSHAPEAMGSLPLSEPLVNVRATLSRCRQLGLVTEEEHGCLLSCASTMFFKERTYRRMAEAAIHDHARALEILALLRANAVDLKRLDALRLIEAVAHTPDARFLQRSDWHFQATEFWKSQFPS